MSALLRRRLTVNSLRNRAAPRGPAAASLSCAPATTPKRIAAGRSARTTQRSTRTRARVVGKQPLLFMHSEP